MSRVRSTVRKGLVTLASGDFDELLGVTLPSMRRYADRHGYQVRVNRAARADRPPPWTKVRLLQHALANFDLVLWVDADAVIVDGRHDIASCLLAGDFQAIVCNTTREGQVPNTGVWLLRRSALALDFLRRVWRCEQFVHHKWWENAAVAHLLGYEVGPPCALHAATRYARATTWLPCKWNSVLDDAAPDPYIVHFAGLPLRERMARALNAAATVS
jgi:hypothetical protein